MRVFTKRNLFIVILFLFGFLLKNNLLHAEALPIEKPVISRVVVESDGMIMVSGIHFTERAAGSIKINVGKGGTRDFPFLEVAQGRIDTVTFSSISDLWDPDVSPSGGEIEVNVTNIDADGNLMKSDTYSGVSFYQPFIDSGRSDKIIIPGRDFVIVGKRFGDTLGYITLMYSDKKPPYRFLCNSCDWKNTQITFHTASLDQKVFENVNMINIDSMDTRYGAFSSKYIPVSVAKKPEVKLAYLNSEGNLIVEGINFTDKVSGSIKIKITGNPTRDFGISDVLRPHSDTDTDTVVFEPSISDLWNPDIVLSNEGNIEVVIRNSDGVASDTFSAKVYYFPFVNKDLSDKQLIPGQDFTLRGKRFGNIPGVVSLLYLGNRHLFYCGENGTICSWKTTEVTLSLSGQEDFFKLTKDGVIGLLSKDLGELTGSNFVPVSVIPRPEVTKLESYVGKDLYIYGKNFTENSDVTVKIVQSGAETTYSSVRSFEGGIQLRVNNFFEFYDPEINIDGGEELEVIVRNNSGVTSVPYRSKVIFGPRIDETSTSHDLNPNTPFVIRGKRFGDSSDKIQINTTNDFCDQLQTCLWTNNSITIQDINKLSSVTSIILGVNGLTSNPFSVNVIAGTPTEVAAPTTKSADFDGSGMIDAADLGKLIDCYSALGSVGDACKFADLDNDNRVNAMDYSLLLKEAKR